MSMSTSLCVCRPFCYFCMCVTDTEENIHTETYIITLSKHLTCLYKTYYHSQQAPYMPVQNIYYHSQQAPYMLVQNSLFSSPLP